jgi:hypothetical protein
MLDQFLEKIPKNYIETFEIQKNYYNPSLIRFRMTGSGALEWSTIVLDIDETVTIEIIEGNQGYVIIDHPNKYILKLYDYGSMEIYIF